MRAGQGIRAGSVLVLTAMLLAAVPHPAHAAQRPAAAAPAGSAWTWSALVDHIAAQLRPLLGWTAAGGRGAAARPPAPTAAGGATAGSSGGSSAGASSDTYPTADPNG
jgi:hypothetical protein